MDLAQRKMRVLSLNFIGIPMMGQMVQDHLYDLGLCAREDRNSVGSRLNVWVYFGEHRGTYFQAYEVTITLDWRTVKALRYASLTTDFLSFPTCQNSIFPSL